MQTDTREGAAPGSSGPLSPRRRQQQDTQRLQRQTAETLREAVRIVRRVSQSSAARTEDWLAGVGDMADAAR